MLRVDCPFHCTLKDSMWVHACRAFDFVHGRPFADNSFMLANDGRRPRLHKSVNNTSEIRAVLAGNMKQIVHQRINYDEKLIYQSEFENKWTCFGSF